MYRKVLTFKNILLCICILIALFSALLESRAYCYTFEQFIQFVNNVADNNITSNAYTHDNALYVKNNFYKIIDTINNNNFDTSEYDSFLIKANNNSFNISEIIVYCFKSGSYLNYGRDGSTSFISFRGQGKTISSTGFINTFSDNWYQYGRCGIFANEPGWDKTAFINNCVSNYNWDPNDHPLTQPFSFIPYGILTSGDWYYQKFSYTGNVCLGELGENEFYQLDITLNNSNMIDLGTISIVPGVGTIDDNSAIFLQGNQVWLKNVYVYYTKPYDLEFRLYHDANTSTIYRYFYRFYPQDSILSNGNITYSGDTAFNGLDMSQLIIGNITDVSNVDNIYGTYFGVSGEIYNDFGYSNYDNDYQDFLLNLYTQIRNSLLSSGDVVFSFEYMGKNMTVHSNDFTVPNNSLKLFANTFLVFGTFVLFFQYLMKFYHRLQEGNIVGALNHTGVNDESFLM